jgi:hypothetical protein
MLGAWAKTEGVRNIVASRDKIETIKVVNMGRDRAGEVEAK